MKVLVSDFWNQELRGYFLVGWPLSRRYLKGTTLVCFVVYSHQLTTLSLKHILNRFGFPELLEVHIGPCPLSEQVFASSKKTQFIL